MTCGLYGEIKVQFLRSGLEITPYEVQTRSGEHKFSYTKVDISRKDGELIDEKAKEYEPVLLKFSGAVQDRYQYHPEAVSLNNDSAKLTLYDAEKVLEQGTINKHFQNTTLKDVVKYVLRRRQDPNRVITGIDHPSEALQSFEVVDKGRLGQDGIVGDAASAFTNAAEKFGNPEFANTSIKLEGTPYQAIQKLAQSFALRTWVDPNGRFRYDLPGSNEKSLVLGVEEGDAKLKEYNVTVGSGKLAQIILQGRYEFITSTPRGGPKQLTSPSTYSYGRAYLIDSDGNKLEGQSKKPDKIVAATNPEDVEATARRELINHYMGRKNGNIVINAGASVKKIELTKLDVGDFLVATAEIEKHCQRKVDTGIFKIQSVQHRLDKRRGWLIDVGVAGLPAADIGSESWLENPETDQRWDSVDEYAASNID
jgi:hypothetical protein